MFIEIGVNELNTLYRSTGLVSDQVYRVINSGNLEPNALTVKFGDFVKWDGSKWVTDNTKLATDEDVDGVVDNWINMKHGGGGTYTPAEDEPLHKGSLVIYNHHIIQITSGPKTDPDTGDTYYTYEDTDLSRAVQWLEGQGLIDLGSKTESDLDSGTLTIDSANSNTNLTLTTAAALTVKANPGLGNFALLIDNSGNANDVTITVTSNNGEDTYLHSSAAGTDVTAGKIAQLTCVGTCWTLAEFEAPTP